MWVGWRGNKGGVGFGLTECRIRAGLVPCVWGKVGFQGTCVVSVVKGYRGVYFMEVGGGRGRVVVG